MIPPPLIEVNQAIKLGRIMKRLFAGTLRANKKLFAGTLPEIKKLFSGTLLANKKFFAGTPMCSFYQFLLFASHMRV